MGVREHSTLEPKWRYGPVAGTGMLHAPYKKEREEGEGSRIQMWGLHCTYFHMAHLPIPPLVPTPMTPGAPVCFAAWTGGSPVDWHRMCHHQQVLQTTCGHILPCVSPTGLTSSGGALSWCKLGRGLRVPHRLYQSPRTEASLSPFPKVNPPTLYPFRSLALAKLSAA